MKRRREADTTRRDLMKRVVTLLDRRLGLLGRFVLLTALALCLLGVGLAHVLRAGAREHALRQAAAFARGIVAVSVENALEDDSPEDGLDPATIQRLDGVLSRSRSADQLLRFKLWNRAGTVVYSDDHALIGRSFPIDGDLRSALSGKLAPNLARGNDGEAEHVEDATLGDLIEVYVPLTGAAGGQPAGVAESYLSFAPFEREVAMADRRLGLVLGGGLLLLLLSLIPIVAGASRRLRRQSETNRHLALHDPLTGLPNRTLFAARVDRHLALASAQRRGHASRPRWFQGDQRHPWSQRRR
jgi:hypothetical protein